MGQTSESIKSEGRDDHGRFSGGGGKADKSGGGDAGAAHQAKVHSIGGGGGKGGVSKNQAVRERQQINNATDQRHFPDRAGKSGYRK